MNDWNPSMYRKEILPRITSYLEQSRWYSGKGRDISETELLDFGTIGSPPEVIIAVVRIIFRKGGSEVYLVTQLAGEDPKEGIMDGASSQAYISSVLDAISRGTDIPLENGKLHGMSGNFHEPAGLAGKSLNVVSGEQSNTSIVIGHRWIYKSFRKLNRGENPDYSVASYLYRKCNLHFVPETLGKITLETGGHAYDAGILTSYIVNSRDGWEATVAAIRDIISTFSSGNDRKATLLTGSLKARMGRLGRITALMHNCFSLDSEDVKFQPEPVTEKDASMWATGYIALLEDMEEALSSFIEVAPEKALEPAEEALGKRNHFLAFAEPLKKSAGMGLYKMRIHGDYHLGQTLVSGDDHYLIDFEGEPMRPLSYRTGKFMPLKDTGGMVRSISYAVDTALAMAGGLHGKSDFPGSLKESLVDAFISSYYGAYAPGNPYLPENPASRRKLLEFFIAEKALYEVVYEIRNRPDFSWIPLQSMGNLFPWMAGKDHDA